MVTVSLSALQVVLLAVIVWLLARKHAVSASRPTDSFGPTSPSQYRILRKTPHGWEHHSYRPEGHPDVSAIRRGEHPDLKIEGE